MTTVHVKRGLLWHIFNNFSFYYIREVPFPKSRSVKIIFSKVGLYASALLMNLSYFTAYHLQLVEILFNIQLNQPVRRCCIKLKQ